MDAKEAQTCQTEDAISSTEADDAESACSMDLSDSESEISDDGSMLDVGENDMVFSAEETLMIFDWDDTLLPSAWLLQQGLHPSKPEMPTSEQRAQLKDLCRCVRRTLRHAKSHGTVVLVTNAERGWIELSCQRYFPGLLPMLESVKIVSARAAHEKPGVTSPTVWKSLAFASEINGAFNSFASEQRKNVISFGDAWHERSAVLEVTKHIPNCCTKSFKFMERPDVAQLQREHELICGCLGHIVSHEGSLDLRVQCPQ